MLIPFDILILLMIRFWTIIIIITSSFTWGVTSIFIYITTIDIYYGSYSVKVDILTVLFMLILTTICLFKFVYDLICLLMPQFIKRIKQRT